MRLLSASALLLMTTVLASGCFGGDGGGDGGSDGGNGGTEGTEPTDGNGGGPQPPAPLDVTVRATGVYPATIAFEPASFSAAPGQQINLTFANEDQNVLVQHDWVLEDVEGASTDLIGSGESTSITFPAPTEPGDYTYYCSVQGHRDNGMEGTLTVA